MYAALGPVDTAPRDLTGDVIPDTFLDKLMENFRKLTGYISSGWMPYVQPTGMEQRYRSRAVMPWPAAKRDFHVPADVNVLVDPEYAYKAYHHAFTTLVQERPTSNEELRRVETLCGGVRDLTDEEKGRRRTCVTAILGRPPRLHVERKPT
jgi:hypothetical protein